MKNLKVLVFSATFGAGHRRAAEAIIEEIRRRVPAAEITHMDWGVLLSPTWNALLKAVYIGMISHTPRLWGLFYYGTAKISPHSWLQSFLDNMGKASCRKLLRELNPDLIICTYPTVSGLLAQLRRSGELSTPVATVVTDYSVHGQWIHKGVDLYVVGCEEVYQGFVSRGIDPGCIHVTGIPVSSRFEEKGRRAEILERCNLPADRTTLLIMGGAYGVLSQFRRICQMAAETTYPCQSLVICGHNQRLYDSLDGVVENTRNPVRRFGFVNNVEDFMSAADLIVTKAGGLIVSESLTKHLPMVIFKPIPGQEEENAKFLERNGAGKTARNLAELERIIRDLLKNPEKLKEMRQSASRVLPGRSAEKTVDLMLQLLSEK